MTLEEIADGLCTSISLPRFRAEILSALRQAAGLTVAELPGMLLIDGAAEAIREDCKKDWLDREDVINLLADRDRLLALLRDCGKDGTRDVWLAGYQQALADIKPLLERLEWSGWIWREGQSHPGCPSCERIEFDREGHAPDCELAAWLAKMGGDE